MRWEWSASIVFSVTFGFGQLGEMELGHGGVKVAVDISLGNERERTIGHFESLVPVIQLRGDIGEAEVRGGVADIGGGGLRAGVARFGDFICSFENLA